MATTLQRQLQIAFLTLLVGVLATGCVTVTNDRLAQNRDPEKATRLYVEAGLRYMQAGNMASANVKLKRAEEISPDDPGVNNALALLYSMESEEDLAEKHFRKALKADPGYSQARNNYAAFLFSQSRYDDAVIQLEQVAKDYLYPKRYAAFENLGISYLKLGKMAEAKSAFNRALQLNSKLPGPVLELANIYFKEGNNLLADRYLKQYESIAQPNPRQLWLGIRLQRVLGDENKLASYELALKNLFPGSEEYKAYKASL